MGQNSKGWVKQDGTEFQGVDETLKRWGEWTNECFSKSQDSLKPRIEHISEEEWGKEVIKPPGNLYEIRRQAELTQIAKEEPGIETWINQDYEEQDINRELWNLANRKAHGNDGIPGEAYRETRQWETKPITEITNLVKNGRPIPERWTEGTIV